MDSPNRTKAYLSSILMAVFTGFSFYAVKIGLQYAGPMEQMTYRYVFAAAAGILVVLLCGRRFGLSLKPTRPLLLLAAFYVGFMGLQATGLVYCTSITSAIIFACVPIMITVSARVFLKEKVTKAQVAAIVTGTVTIIYVMLRSGSEVTFKWQGLVLMLLAAGSLTVYSLLIRGKREELHPLQVPIYCSVMGAAALILFSLLHCIAAGDAASMVEPLQHPGFLISTLYLGICCILISTLLAAYAAAHLPAVQTSAFNNISTVISLLAGALLLSEPLHAYEVIGSLIIITSVFVVNAAGPRE